MSAKPFLFNLAFDGDDEPPVETAAPPAAPPVYDEEALDAERKAAFAAGYAEGEAAARAEAAAAAQTAETQALEAIAAGVHGALAAADAARGTALALAPMAAAEALKRAFPAFARVHGDGEILGVLRDALMSAHDEPRLVVRLADADYERIEPKIADAVQRAGFAGRIVSLEDAAIAPGDVRVEWADGGLIRDASRLADALAEALADIAADVDDAAPNTADATAPAGIDQDPQFPADGRLTGA